MQAHPIKVAVWTPERKGVTPGQRFRIEEWEPFLRADGVEVVYLPFQDADTASLLKETSNSLSKAIRLVRLLAHRLRQAAGMTGFDLVYVFRETALLGPALAERLLRRRGLPYVFDFDDAVWIRYRSPANSFWSYLRCPGKTATTCRLSHHVMAGNETLARYARQFAPSVSIIPTTIDTELYVPPPAKREPGLVIGWSGSYSTGQYLELVRAVLQRLARRFRFRGVVVGAREFRVEGVDVEVRPWRAETEVTDLSDFDVGLMPLPDSDWERGKCGLKALQYMALGIPPVVSPVGVNSSIVIDGQNGLVARTESDWENALGRLLEDASLRKRLGHEARATVEGAYSARIHAPRVADIFRAVATAQPRRQRNA
jgi:glycosyltransferase involved in cell wall biosynthesis